MHYLAPGTLENPGGIFLIVGEKCDIFEAAGNLGGNFRRDFSVPASFCALSGAKVGLCGGAMSDVPVGCDRFRFFLRCILVVW